MTNDPSQKAIRWTLHAISRQQHRGIDPEQVRLTVADPERIVPGSPPRRIYMRRIGEDVRGRTLLLRVTVEESASELTVLSAYVTTKASKYWKEEADEDSV